MIEDKELRELFKTASEEHLQNIENALMRLEKNPQDREQLEEILREAHTLKGDSRMLGADDVETIVHQMEDICVAVKKGESKLTKQVCDRLYAGLDAVTKLVKEAVTGEAANINVFYVLAQLMGADDNAVIADQDNVMPPPALEELDLFADVAQPSLVTNDVDALFGELTAPIASQNGSGQVAAEPEKSPIVAETSESNNGSEIKTIRVEPQKLDSLMTQAGELTVTKIRIAHHIAEVEELIALYEEWNRDAYVNRVALDNAEKRSQIGAEQVQSFYHRGEKRLERLGAILSRLKNQAYEDTARLEIVANELESGIRALRLLPLSTVFNAFRRMVRDLANQQSKSINLIIEGGDTTADKRILEEIKDPLMHMIRNAIDHGIETAQEREKAGKPKTATIRLRGYQTASSIGIELIDDGRGLDIESIKRTALRRGVCSTDELAKMTTNQIQSLIFAPGFSTRTEVTELSGRGVGLDVVRAKVEQLKGTLQVESLPGKGCTFRLQLLAAVATTHVLIVEVNNVSYAIPVEFVNTTLLVSRSEIFAIDGCHTISLEGQPVSVSWLSDLLQLPVNIPASPKALDSTSNMLPCIVLQVGNERLGLLVDALVDQQNIVLKPQSKLLQRVRNVSGATILGTGEVCMVLNAQDLLKSVQKRTGAGTIPESLIAEVKKPAVLLVEDSITIRTQVKRILEGAGYDVTAAVDGLDGFNKLRANTFDAVVSDVQMPNLDGLSLAARIRQHKEYSELPIILVTTLASDEDKRRGAEAGANAYLTKGNFEQKLLLDTLKRLI
ncbi:hybrid sensor histidine kinase/response regulator [Aliterella atlantica]|uniref:histidine kinase n=1 Tax=Aliterella atlantica CENA595 TaxID=1618023 RepID=A0A0D8ZSN0_9CYAN|nr:hybrid sensor histidine kinase/response regulator [Aliterella atlantica]KJH71367.1 chemotaxis protein CheA [Aliterella atlantica CENA595]